MSGYLLHEEDDLFCEWLSRIIGVHQRFGEIVFGIVVLYVGDPLFGDIPDRIDIRKYGYRVAVSLKRFYFKGGIDQGIGTGECVVL